MDTANRIQCAVTVCLLLAAGQATASPITYSFNGLISGYVNEPPLFLGLPVRVDYIDLPFQSTILADTDNLTSVKLAGIGTTWRNPAIDSTFSIEGFSTVEFTNVTVFSSPGLFRIGFQWNGYWQQSATFSGTYHDLNGPMAPDDIHLLSTFDSTSPYPLLATGTETFHITGFNSVSYEAAVVPLPAPLVLMLSSLLVAVPFARKKRRHTPCT